MLTEVNKLWARKKKRDPLSPETREIPLPQQVPLQRGGISEHSIQRLVPGFKSQLCHFLRVATGKSPTLSASTPAVYKMSG